MSSIKVVDFIRYAVEHYNVIVTAPNISHDLRMILCRVVSRRRKQLDSITATGRRTDAIFMDRETK
jgi:hypothetical protein